jgi:bacterioferritin-associated ferredoxin
MIQGLRYIYRLKRAGVQILPAHVLQGLQGNQEVEKASLAKVDACCRPISGETKHFDVDTVCIGYGLIPTTWVTSMLGCTHVYDPLIGGWAPQFNQNMQTDRPGVFVAGDGAGIAGVLVAKMEGTLAGLFAAVHAGGLSDDKAMQAAQPVRKKLTGMRKFRRAIDRMYRIYPDLYTNITDDTIVCRCEGIAAVDIRKAIRRGTMNLNDIKKRTRSGMGYCQGTNCLPTIAVMLAREFDARPEEIPMMTTRPPARPIPLHLLMVDMEIS